MYQIYADNQLIYDARLSELTLFNPQLNLILGEVGKLTFTITDKHPRLNLLSRMKTIIRVKDDEETIFRGRILNDIEDFNKRLKIECESDLAFLNDSIFNPFEHKGTIKELFVKIIDNHNQQVDEIKRFKIGNVTVTDSNDYINRSSEEYLNSLQALQEKLVKPLGGHLHIRYEKDGNYIDYLSDFPFLTNQKIEIGKNILDLSSSLEGDEIATVIIPLGKKDDETKKYLDITAVNNGKNYIADEEAIQKYGRITKVEHWDNVTIDSNLLQKGKKRLGELIHLSGTIDITAVDLSKINKNIESFKIGTKVNVISEIHGIDAYYLVTKLTLNLQKPWDNRLQLGGSYKTLTDATLGNKPKDGKDGVSPTINLEKDGDKTKVTVTDKNGTKTTEIVDGYSKDEVNKAVESLKQEAFTKIEQTQDTIVNQVESKYSLVNEIISEVKTSLVQTAEGININFERLSKNLDNVIAGNTAEFEKIKKYIRFENGNIILGAEGNPLTLKIENDKIKFIENGAEIAYWQNRQFYAVDGEFINSLKLGKFAFIPRQNGNLSFLKVVN